MNTTLLTTALISISTTSSAFACGTYSPPQEQRYVDLAICLDTSNSMDGLIDSARQTLWAIVNDLALAEPTPKLRVALLAYGSPGYPESDGWVVVETPFTDNLDLVSERLFALETDGGTELVGRVLGRAADVLDWSDSEDSLRLAIVAGNESADQDQKRSYKEVCKSLIERGIMVNSIYCGNPADDIAPSWRNVALLADGHFACIDQDNGTVVIASPFDDELVTLSSDLNKTYLPYGETGRWAELNQTRQDENASGLSTAVAAQRCETKASALYSNTSWDLVDAAQTDDFNIDSIENSMLPESMREMTRDEKIKFISDMSSERKSIQKKVHDLTKKRAEFIAQEREKLTTEDKSFDGAIRRAIREQATARGFRFPNDTEVTTAKISLEGC